MQCLTCWIHVYIQNCFPFHSPCVLEQKYYYCRYHNTFAHRGHVLKNCQQLFVCTGKQSSHVLLNINNKGKQGLGSLVPLQASFAALIKHAKQNPIQLEETILSMTHNAFHDTQRSMRNALVGKLQSDCIMWTTDDITFIMVSTDWQTYSCLFAVIQNKHVKYRILHCLRTTHFQFNFGRRPWNKVGLRLNCGLPSLLFSHSRLCTWLGQEACRECCRSARDTG